MPVPCQVKLIQCSISARPTILLSYSTQHSVFRNGESHLPFTSAALISCTAAGLNYNSDVTQWGKIH